MSEPNWTEEEKGERQALLEVRSFVARHGPKEVDQYCAQRLHDMRMDRLACDRAPGLTASAEALIRPAPQASSEFRRNARRNEARRSAENLGKSAG